MNGENMEKKIAEERQTVKSAEKKQKPRKKRRWIRRLMLILVLLCALGLWGWSTVSRLQAEYTVTYDPYTATTGSISNSLSFTGTMQLIDSATYTAGADTKVREVYVALGDSVRDGDKVYLQCRTVSARNGNGVVTAVDGSNYTVMVTSGAFLPGDSVDIYREEIRTDRYKGSGRGNAAVSFCTGDEKDDKRRRI